MGTYKSIDSESSLVISRDLSHTSFGSKDFKFNIHVSSYGFTALVPSVYFYDTDLEKFVKAANKVINFQQKSASLEAMSEFHLSLVAANRQGHFLLNFKMQRLVYEISSNLVVILETQSVSDLLRELRSN